MDANKRSILLRKRDILQCALASELGVKPSTLSLVLSGKSRSRRVEEGIAARLDIPYEELWGDKPRRRAA